MHASDAFMISVYVLHAFSYICWAKKLSYFYQYWQVIEAGANALVAGSAVFGAKDYAEGMDSVNLYESERDVSFFIHKWMFFDIFFVELPCSYKRN